jgi:hypothetical protein
MQKDRSTVRGVTKQKLSPAERSQVAKERWAKRRATAQSVATSSAQEPAVIETILVTPEAEALPALDQAPSVISEQEMSFEEAKAKFVAPPPAPQLTPAAPKKQKRYTGPKEFSVALKAAESRLAKAITERGETAGRLAALNAEIPSLLGIINALKGPQNYAPPAPYNASVPYDLSLGMPNAAAFQAPMPHFQPPINPMEMIQNAAAALPVSRASGGAIQFSPEVLGSLEGPEDDDNPDKYITGPLAGGGWK